MRIKIFIVTYNGENHLRDNLTSLFASDNFDSLDVQVNIINNHSNFYLYPPSKFIITIYDPISRPVIWQEIGTKPSSTVSSH